MTPEILKSEADNCDAQSGLSPAPLLGDGTELYRKTMAEDYGDAEQKALMKSEWSPTPWMLDVFTGDLDGEIRDWCYRSLGRQSSPMHGHEGIWRRGNVTMHGRTWFGFKTKELMEQFKANAPSPNNRI